jgi:galactokinase/mevalonate kinase-like predicted kinase
MTDRKFGTEFDMDNLYQVERQARQMRAEAMADALHTFGQWLDRRWNALRGASGHQAA